MVDLPFIFLDDLYFFLFVVYVWEWVLFYGISGMRYGVREAFAVLGCYGALVGS